jgi:hypothetical protein
VCLSVNTNHLFQKISKKHIQSEDESWIQCNTWLWQILKESKNFPAAENSGKSQLTNYFSVNYNFPLHSICVVSSVVCVVSSVVCVVSRSVRSHPACFPWYLLPWFILLSVSIHCNYIAVLPKTKGDNRVPTEFSRDFYMPRVFPNKRDNGFPSGGQDGSGWERGCRLTANTEPRTQAALLVIWQLSPMKQPQRENEMETYLM